MNELNAFNLGFWLPDFSIFVLILNVAFGLWTVHQNRKKLENMLKYLSKKNFSDMKFCLRSMLDAYSEFILVVSGPKICR